MFVFKNSKASQDFLVIDPKFVNGASANAKMRQVGFGNWAGEAGFRVGWTTRIVVSSPEKSRVAGASVTARDSAGNTVFEGKTDGGGVVVLPLVERRYFNTKTEAFSEESLSPYSVAVEATGFIPANQYVKATQTQEVDITLKSK